MKTFKFVEDYIEFIGGYRDYSGKQLILFEVLPSPINLARYDVKIINSLCVQTAEMNRPYTDKQSELAVKLVQKYKKQLSNLDRPIAVPDILDNFRLGIRLIDRTKTVKLVDNKIIVKFPYDIKLISLMKKQVHDGQGSTIFHDEDKSWSLGLTENMINWVMAVLPSFDFVIDQEIKDLFNKILEVESKAFDIKLVLQDNKLTITNANESLIAYVEQKLGGFNTNNIIKLVDYGPVLQYSIDSVLHDLVKLQVTELEYDLIIRRINKFKKDRVSIDQILEYARKTERLPIYVYDTGLPKSNTNEIIYLNRNFNMTDYPKLLITYTNLMIGTRKQGWYNNAEKVIVLE